MFSKRLLPAMFMSALCLMMLAGVASGQTSGDSGVSLYSGTESGGASDTQLVSRPKSFDLGAMDKTVNPCENFYEYACGSWRKNNPIPGDQSRWGRFNELAEYNRQVLHEILEKASHATGPRNAVQQKIGDLYGACMDETAINVKGTAPLKPILERIAGVTTKDQLIDTLAWLQSQGIGGILFGFGAAPDLHNSSVEIANVAQSGLGLPDRDYYLKDDPKSQETRQRYVAHMTNMFVLLGDSPEASAKEAQAVMDIETKLAQATMERVKIRDPKNRDHKMKVAELVALAPNLSLERYFQGTGAPSFTEVNVVPPDFFQAINQQIEATSVADWKTYVRWHVTRGSAAWLSDAFVKENFSFQAFLSGQKELPVRWKRCVQLTDRLLGEALGQDYVHDTFGKEGKDRMLKMVNALEEALGEDIRNLDWMTPDTKKQAEGKLHLIANKIGYPENWRDYSTVTITRNDLLADIRQASAFEEKRDLKKIGKPIDKAEWGMTPPTVNAYYNPPENNINFPAGILQPPFFSQSVDDAVNFGGIGVVIGHELTHGFDDQGSKYDGTGNLSNWWTDADRQEFDKRTSCIADEYGSFTAVDDVHLNGRLTLGENTADNGGLHIALMALRKDMASNPKVKQTIEGFTAEQRFFIGFAQVWCSNSTPESSRLLVKTDPHSPGEFRTNGTVQNSEDFAKAFGCKAGQKMVSTNACHVW